MEAASGLNASWHRGMFAAMAGWSAIALGLLTFSGEHPEIGPRFFDLFMFP
jgi:hypothetical protein